MFRWDRIIVAFARLVMIATHLYYTLVVVSVWGMGMAGNSKLLYGVFGLPEDGPAPEFWRMLVGASFGLSALAGLALAFWSAHRLLSMRHKLDEAILIGAIQMRRLASGLMLFWLGYNLLVGVTPLILAAGFQAPPGIEWDYDPLDTHIIIAILGVTLYAAALVLEQAREIKEENREFV